MKPSRGFLVWTALGVCAVLVIGAMMWLTRNVLAAERERAAAQQERAAAEARADLEERTRLALWRMDALGAAVVLRESRHPTTHYDLLTGSPLLTATDPELVRLCLDAHWVFRGCGDSEWTVCSPIFPSGSSSHKMRVARGTACTKEILQK